MFLSRILAGYISRLFMISVLAVLAALTGLVSLFDFLELLRRSGLDCRGRATGANVHRLINARRPQSRSCVEHDDVAHALLISVSCENQEGRRLAEGEILLADD